MKSVNVVKIMNDSKKEQEKNRTDKSSGTELLNKVHKFVSAYVMNRLDVLGSISVGARDLLDNTAIDLVMMLNDLTIEDLNKEEPMFPPEEIGFLDSKDTKIKSSVGKKLADYLIRWYTYEDKRQEFIKEYITPKLMELNNNGIIDYNLKSLDNKSKLAVKRIDNFINKFVKDSANASMQFTLFGGLYGEEFINKWDFIFSDNEKIKKDFADLTYDFLKENINEMDFKNLDSTDFADYTGAKINVYVKK